MTHSAPIFFLYPRPASAISNSFSLRLKIRGKFNNQNLRAFYENKIFCGRLFNDFNGVWAAVRGAERQREISFQSEKNRSRNGLSLCENQR
jgi:hypothetical protein